jgi:hypothetical protein
MDIDSRPQTETHTERVVRPPTEWSVVAPTPTETLIHDFNNPVMDPDEKILNTSSNILDDEEPKYYREAISSPNADLWHSAIEAEMDALWRNHSSDVVDRSTDRMIVDFKWVFIIKHHSNGSVHKFKARLVVKAVSQILGPDYNKTCTALVCFDSLRILLSIVAANRFVPQQLDFNTTFMFSKLKETIYMPHPEGD